MLLIFLTNSASETKEFVVQANSNVNVTGFNSVICNSNGDPWTAVTSFKKLA
jgi:hypothetical protein